MDLETALRNGVPLQFKQGFIARIAAIYPDSFVRWVDAKGTSATHFIRLSGKDVVGYAPIMTCLQTPTRKQVETISKLTLPLDKRSPVWEWQKPMSPPWHNRELPPTCTAPLCVKDALTESLGYFLFPQDNTMENKARHHLKAEWIDGERSFLVVSKQDVYGDYVLLSVYVWGGELPIIPYLKELEVVLSKTAYNASIPWQVMQKYVAYRGTK